MLLAEFLVLFWELDFVIMIEHAYRKSNRKYTLSEFV